jgi:hypothetical protein
MEKVLNVLKKYLDTKILLLGILVLVGAVMIIFMFVALSSYQKLVLVASEGGRALSTYDRYRPGTHVTVFASPDSDYVFSGWVALEGQQTPGGFSYHRQQNTFKMPKADLFFRAEFIPKGTHNLTVIAGEGGTVLIGTESGDEEGADSITTEYKSGTRVTIRAIPDHGYIFLGWEGFFGDARTNAVYEFEMPNSPLTVTAVFQAVPTEDDTSHLLAFQQPHIIKIILYSGGKDE